MFPLPSQERLSYQPPSATTSSPTTPYGRARQYPTFATPHPLLSLFLPHIRFIDTDHDVARALTHPSSSLYDTLTSGIRTQRLPSPICLPLSLTHPSRSFPQHPHGNFID
ncbi:hypothetical protein FRC03_005215 [Tulasnella sp. 419]|nr:hypothetical protein FRC03_005215 [Tulasnella sp. 419]